VLPVCLFEGSVEIAAEARFGTHSGEGVGYLFRQLGEGGQVGGHDHDGGVDVVGHADLYCARPTGSRWGAALGQ